MSALGNRYYASPEVINGIHEIHEKLSNSSHSFSAVDITRTLHGYVSDYGMFSDAYSLGVTMKYMLTGAR